MRKKGITEENYRNPLTVDDGRGLPRGMQI